MKLSILVVANKEGARAGNRFRPRFREERSEGSALGLDPKAPLRPRMDNNELGKPSCTGRLAFFFCASHKRVRKYS
jgi:hypothetical protein